MGVLRQLVFVSVMFCVGCANSAAAATAAAPDARTENLFDPARHMRVAEVRPGMKGYGLSVFKGTKIERFEVEVISVLRNFNPKHDVILIRASGADLEHSGAIQGMSGSPIYLADDQGRERMIGAFAYGWPLLKDPLAGVQPIEYMLDLPDGSDKAVAASQPMDEGRRSRSGAGAGARPGMRPRMSGPIRWSALDVLPLPGQAAPRAFPTRGLRSFEPNPAYFDNFSDKARLSPLATPLMIGGVPAGVLDVCAPLLRAYGLSPLQAGGGGSPHPNQTDTDNARVSLEPGSTLAVPLVTGDVDFTLIGTVTETLGDRVFGFGHPFNNEGPVSLPMGTGEINGILARLDQSMKLGSLIKLNGALTTDQSVGVAGKIGQTPVTAPVELRVKYADGTQDLTYRYDCAIHPRLTPMLSGVALAASISGARELPQFHTLEYELTIEFDDGQIVRMRDVSVNAGPAWALENVVFPLLAATDNPFEKVALKRITGSLTVLPEAREAKVLSVNVPKLKYKPGETIKAFVTYRPFRAAEAIVHVELQLPSDLSDGTYQLVVSGHDRYLTDEAMAQPFRFTAENSEQMFDVIRDLVSLRHDALYVRLLRQPDGIAVGRVAMPRLPSSRRQVLLGAGRSNTTPFVSSTVKTIPTQYVMDGEADFAIEIDADERVETGAGAAAARPPKSVEPHTTPTQPPGEVKLPRSPRQDPEKPEPGKPEPGKPERDAPENPD